tara:strand:+ start:251 stop:667 length:417 start_codon:yes stop_codon:yes gene_type:complete
MIVNYNTNNWPYVKIKFLNNSVTDKGFDKHITNFRNLYKKCEETNTKMIIIFDLREVPASSIKYVKQQVRFNKEIKPLSRIWIKHSFFLTSTIGKGILDIVFSFEKPVSSYNIYSNEKDLIDFIKEYDSNKETKEEEE